MELVEILKALRRKRAWVAVAGAIALLGALSVLYRPGLPPESRATSTGAGTTEILIDAPESTLGDLHRDIAPLVTRGGIFSHFLATDEAAREIARESGIRPRQITVARPRLVLDGVPDQTSTRPPGAGDYLVQVKQGDNLPVLSIFTQAPTAAGARRLADATAAALSNAVTRVQEETGVREARRLTIRQLGTARAGMVEKKPSGVLAVGVFFVVFAGFCLAILAWPRLVEAWRAPGPAQGLHRHGSSSWEPPLGDEDAQLLPSLASWRVRQKDGFDPSANDDLAPGLEDEVASGGPVAKARPLRRR